MCSPDLKDLTQRVWQLSWSSGHAMAQDGPASGFAAIGNVVPIARVCHD